MNYSVFATLKFRQQKRKSRPEFQEEIDKQVQIIAKNPQIGEIKKGDLSGIYVHKFKFENLQILLAYRLDKKNSRIILYSLGSHENFYRDLKRYIKK